MVRAEIDARVGGRFTFTERRDGQDVEHTGEYLEIDRPRRLAFTFGVPKYSSEFARVTVEIAAQGHSCELTLTQENTKPEWVSRSTDGWTQIVQGLAASLGDRAAAANLKPGEFTAPGEVRIVRILPGPIERVWSYITDSEKRATWFAGGPIELRVGGRAELLFKHSQISPHETPPEKYREVHDPGVGMVGLVTQCEPPRLLAFTWDGATLGEGSEVLFELSPQGDEVQLTLTHRKLQSDAERINVSSGWHLHTAILAAHLTGATPPPLWAAHSRLEAAYAKRLRQGAATT